MSETTERIAQIRTEAEAAIAAAAKSEDLEEARIRFLGRKAELPNLLRTVAELPAQERADLRQVDSRVEPDGQLVPASRALPPGDGLSDRGGHGRLHARRLQPAAMLAKVRHVEHVGGERHPGKNACPG